MLIQPTVMPPLPPTGRTRDTFRLATVLVPAAAGLVASAILLVDYLRPMPVFCDGASGCAQVKRTIFANLGGIPTPAFGVVAFLLLGNLALVRGRAPRVAQLVISILGALGALALIGVQLNIGAICKYCMMADASMIVLASASMYRWSVKWDLGKGFLLRGLGEGFLVSAIAIPSVLGMTMKAWVPKEIADELAKTPKGQVTVVDFVDFECPFCRMTHEEFSPVAAKHKGQLRVVRKQVPLARIHPHAMTAALAACCGEQLGQGDAMAEALFSTPVEELSPEKCEELAQKLGLPLEAFRTCVTDPQTQERIKADTAMFRASGALGLPTIWIGDVKLEGAQPTESLEHAVDQALAKAGS